MTDDEPKRAAFRQVADEVRDHILKGTYAPGLKLPTEGELAKEHGTNRGTAGQALRLLAAEGLISKSRRGAFVGRIVHKMLRDDTSRCGLPAHREEDEDQARGTVDAEIRSLGMTPMSITSTTPARPPAWVADLLGTDATSESTLVQVLRVLADDVPVQLATSYIPRKIARGTRLEELGAGPGGSKSRLADYAPAQTVITEQVNVRTPSPQEIGTLALDMDQRVFEITHIGRTEEGKAVEVTVHVMPTHLWTLAYSWPQDPTN